MIMFLLNWCKRREGLQFLFHFVGALTIGNSIHHLHGLFVSFSPVEPLSYIFS